MNSQNGAALYGKLVTASAVRIAPRTIQGWRPHSVTSQPDSSATRPSGPDATSRRRNQGASGSARRRSASAAASTASAAIAVPVPTIASKARCSSRTGGQSARGNASSPVTVASMSL